jgi:hypothetical protein
VLLKKDLLDGDRKNYFHGRRWIIRTRVALAAKSRKQANERPKRGFEAGACV